MTNETLELFKPLPYQRHSETSKRAARAAAPGATTLASLTLRALRSCGTRGATDEELAAMLPGKRPESVRARRVGLVHEGLARDSGARRLSQYDHAMVVWIANPSEQLER